MIPMVSEVGRLSIPYESDNGNNDAYAYRMGNKDRTPLGWGTRFRVLAAKNGFNMAKVAELMDKAESTVRSWTNGTRDINLVEFLTLCEKSKVDPAECLFGGQVDQKWLLVGRAWVIANKDQRGAFVTVAKGVLAEHGESSGSQGNESHSQAQSN